MLPACMMPQIRQQLTVDALTNFSVTAGITSFYIYNIQLTYQLIDFGSEVQNMVMSVPKFLIKSNGWSNSATSIAAGVTGSQSIIFNQRFASIKSALILSSGGTNCVNKSFHSRTRKSSFGVVLPDPTLSATWPSFCSRTNLKMLS